MWSIKKEKKLRKSNKYDTRDHHFGSLVLAQYSYCRDEKENMDFFKSLSSKKAITQRFNSKLG